MTAGGFNLVGRRVLVTGAASGIGAATTRVCAGLGADVILVDAADPSALARDIPRASARRADVSSREDVERLLATAGPLDAVVASAAIRPGTTTGRTPPGTTASLASCRSMF